MKKSIIISSFAALALVCSSCNPDLLNIPQMGVTSEENFYVTDQDCDQATAAVYNASRKVLTGKPTIGAYENAFFLKNLLSDDIRTGSSRTDQTKLQQIWEMHLVTTNDWFRIIYQEYYSSIYLANIVLEKFDAADSQIKARNIAECRGLRALAYYDLVTLWGRVPLVTTVLKTADEFQVANTEIPEIWKFIEDELNDIINGGHLTQRNGIGDKNGSARFTIDAARTLLGKAYMYQGKYAEAKEVLTDVIESGNFGLISDITTFYHPQANGCEEYIYEHVRHYDMSTAYDQDGWHGILWNWPFALGFNMGSEAMNFYKFNSQGYAQCQVPKDLYDAFVAEEGEDGMRVNAWIVPITKFPEIGIGIAAEKTYYNSEGYLRLKWLASTDDENVGMWHANQANTPVFKYDDVLLLAAEACVQTGDNNKALEYVNQVRARVNLAPIGDINMDVIKKERRLELAMDGVRFQDLKRWGDAPTVLAEKSKMLPYLTVSPDPDNDPNDPTYKSWKYTFTVEYKPNDYSDHSWTVGRDDYLPFPQNEIDVNKKLQQNPGY